MARAREGDLEMHHTATFRTHLPCTIQWTWMTCLPPGAHGLTGSRRSGRRSGSSGAPWNRSSSHQCSMFRWLMEEQLLVDAFAQHDIRVSEQVIEVPKILINELPVRIPVREPQLAEQLVDIDDHLLFLVAADCAAERRPPLVWWRPFRFSPGHGSTASDFLRTFQLVPWTSRFMFFFSHFSQAEKKCEVGSALGTECGLYFIHAVCLRCTPLI